MFDQERRRHPRYYLSLSVRLHRGAQELGAEIVNASAGGCLLRVPEPLPQGEVFEVSLPELQLPRARLVVLRSDAAGPSYLVATYFDSPMADEEPFRQLSNGHPGGSAGPLVN
jgi:PilZ domain